MILEATLENINIHEDLTVAFTPGVNAIVGPGGSGKTTILEAIAFALFDHVPGTKISMLRHGARWGMSKVTFRSRLNAYELFCQRSVTDSDWDLVEMFLSESVVCQGKKVVVPELTRHLDLGNLPLSDVYQCAIGVPQGTWTAPFLLPEAQRLGFFERLTGVNQLSDVYTASRSVARHLKFQVDQALAEIGELQHLEIQAREGQKIEFSLGQQIAEMRESLESTTAAWVAKNEIFLDLDERRSEYNLTVDKMSELHKIGHRCPTCQQLVEKDTKELILRQLSQELRTYKYDPSGYQTAQKEERSLYARIAELSGKIETLENYLKAFDPPDLDGVRQDLAGANQTFLEADRKLTACECHRETIRGLAPEVSARLIDVITGPASEMFQRVTGMGLEIGPTFDIWGLKGKSKLAFSPNLSGSQQMLAALAVRLSIARYVLGAEFVFLDEPTMNMDPGQVDRLAEALPDFGFPQMVVVSHDERFLKIAENTIVL